MSWWRRSACDGDPGPCPVDDTPHTACTPESVASLAQHFRPSQTVSTTVSPPFSTGEYRRAVHGLAARHVPREPARASSSPSRAVPAARAAASSRKGHR